jgi:uncharacterized membrane protein
MSYQRLSTLAYLNYWLMSRNKPNQNNPAHVVSATAGGKGGVLTQLTYESSGPVIDPILVRAYNTIEPGLGTEIVRQGIKQTDHRIVIETMAVKHNNRRSWGGLISGAVIALVLIYAGYDLTMHNHDTVGGIVLGSTLVAVVGTFIWGRESQAKERIKKSNVMARAIESLQAPKTSTSE